jgi:hypothetical protein
MDLMALLGGYFCDTYNISEENDYKIEKIKARELIVAGRIDLIAKLKYVEYKEKGYDLSFIKEVYIKHIEAFTFGSYSENGNDNKNSIEQYLNTFDYLIESIKENGIDENISVIPVGRNNQIMDGAHRAAIAAYFDLEIPIVRLDHLIANNNTEFFRERLLDEFYLDYLVTEYCKFKHNVYIAVCWPRAKGKLDEVEELMKQTGEVVYKKKIDLTYNGLRNFIIQVYCSHDWIGGLENHFEGATPQIEGCYDKDGIINAYVLECDSLDQIVKMKQNIRKIYGVGNYSIHSSDNQNETIQISKLIFNNNSIMFLNGGKPDYYVDFNGKLSEFKERLLASGFSLENFIVDSSSPLGLYGLRNIRDIDFMTISDGYEILENECTGNHHEYIDLYETTKEDLILNPNNYFVYNEIKFTTLNVLRRFKKNRGEEKDLIDVKLIDSLFIKKHHCMMALLKFESTLRRRKRNLKYYSKQKLIHLFKKMGLYGEAKKFYHFVRDRRG